MAVCSLSKSLFLVLTFGSLVVSIHGLDVGLSVGNGLQLFTQCSRQCESKFCGAPPFLRYGKYCGLLYTGCPGETPCDQLDACCMGHDQCIARKGNSYLSQECNSQFTVCVQKFKKLGSHAFKGNTCNITQVVTFVTEVMDAAVLAGIVFGKP